MSQKADTAQMIVTLQEFQKLFGDYSNYIFGRPGAPKHEFVNELVRNLRLMEPKVTDIINKVDGARSYSFGRISLSAGELIRTALLGGNNAMPHNFGDFDSSVNATIDGVIGVLQAGLWPPQAPEPVLVIKDEELRARCYDLLSAPGNYDRVVREATTVLEDRIRRRPPHAVLAKVIPNANDQTGNNLIDKLFNPDNPVLSISNEKTRRVAFRIMLVGVVSYLRNPYHHNIDDATEWSWAWSTIGLIDKLLADVDSCTMQSI